MGRLLSEGWFQGIVLALFAGLLTGVIVLLSDIGGVREAQGEIRANWAIVQQDLNDINSDVNAISQDIKQMRVVFDASQVNPKEFLVAVGAVEQDDVFMTAIHDGWLYAVPDAALSAKWLQQGMQTAQITPLISGFRLVKADEVAGLQPTLTNAPQTAE